MPLGEVVDEMFGKFGQLIHQIFDPFFRLPMDERLPPFLSSAHSIWDGFTTPFFLHIFRDSEDESMYLWWTSGRGKGCGDIIL